jgi:iron complex outermembrane recepter protein
MKNKNSVRYAVGLALLAGSAVAQEQQAPEGNIEEVLVIGSRIPRVKSEGPAPVTIIDSKQIDANGLTSVPDVLKALTQNTGATQSQQSFGGASFTPGAEQVDLRGLGNNHTLVLVNGRRIADFPLPFNGLNNFTDISNIPLGMIDRVEVLSGSASAVYGSDAIAGVVNFVLKKDVEGLDVNYRFGAAQDGNGQSQRLSMTAGWSKDRFHSVFGVELLDKQPLWAYDRTIQDSTADNPTTESAVARRDFLRIDPYEDVYVDPGQATCSALSYTNQGSTYRGSRPGWGPYDDDLEDYGPGHYCGSDTSIGYGTVENQRRSVSGYASLNFDLSDNTTLFADIMAGGSTVKMFRDVLKWDFQDANGSEDGIFFNDTDEALDSWYRQFTPEEMGGLSRGEIVSNQTTFTVTPGIKGKFGDSWDYELYLNHTEYKLSVSWPQIVASKANDLFLGPQTGVDEDSGYASFAPDISRLYTPLTVPEYDSIATHTVYHPESRNDYLSLTFANPELWQMPAGGVGFAANLEVGNQAYDLNPDPKALEYYYYKWRDQDGHGERNHWGGGLEFRMPVLETLEVSAAGRYDNYHFASDDTGKFTYNIGLEFRPISTLLLRGYYGTGFRAPDLHYVFAGEGNTHEDGTDYYLCRTEEPDNEDIGDCSYSDEGLVATHSGNPELQSETSTSLGAGVVWQPVDSFMVSLDYFKIDLKNEVLDLNINTLLETEADCRIGETTGGTPVDISTPTCQAALSRVQRYSADNPISPNQLFGVRVNPINVAKESTSGVDVAFNYNVPIGVTSLTLNGSYTYVIDHDSQQYPGDPEVDQFDPESGFVIPRSKASLSASLDVGDWTTTLHVRRLDKLANYDEDGRIDASYTTNFSVGYAATEKTHLRLTIDNLTDRMPVKDPTYASYPYYDISWFDSVGRSFFVEISHNFGGQ